MRPKFVDGGIYHIYNRGVEKRKIFIKNQDYFRFIHDLYEFNDEAPALNLYYKFPVGQSYEVRLRKIEEEKKRREPRKLLIEILSFCLMPNHFHLLVRQNLEKGIVRFMQKLGTGYTNYFNSTYERVGPLFQGRYKSVSIDKEVHLLHIPYYIHANPIDIIEPSWKESKFDIKKILNHVESYRWSSYLDYIGKKNFPSVTQRDFLKSYFNNNLEKDFLDWILNINLEWDNFKDFSFEKD